MPYVQVIKLFTLDDVAKARGTPMSNTVHSTTTVVFLAFFRFPFSLPIPTLRIFFFLFTFPFPPSPVLVHGVLLRRWWTLGVLSVSLWLELRLGLGGGQG